MQWHCIGEYSIEYGDESHVRKHAYIPYVNEGRSYRVVLSYEGYAQETEGEGLVGQGFPITGKKISLSFRRALESFLDEPRSDRIYVVMQRLLE